MTRWRNLSLVKQHFQIGTILIQLHQIFKINYFSSVQHIIVLFPQKVSLFLPITEFYSCPLCAAFFTERNNWSFCIWSGYPSEKLCSTHLGPEDIGTWLLPGKLNPQGLRIHPAAAEFCEEYLLLSHCNWRILRVTRKDFLLSEELILWLKVKTVAMCLCCSYVINPVKTHQVLPKYSYLPTQSIMSNIF